MNRARESVRSRLVGTKSRVSPALVVAALALFVALSGTAVATTSALITGKQIKNGSITGLDVKNKSLTATDVKGRLRGARGLPGTPGAQGAKGDKGEKGDEGDTGNQGPAGPIPATLPSGQTITGVWSYADTKIGSGFVDVHAISFTYPLSAAPANVLRPIGALPTAACPGTVTDPKAAPGILCVYVRRNENDRSINLYATSRFGAYLGPEGVPDNGSYDQEGTWAVTAP